MVMLDYQKWDKVYYIGVEPLYQNVLWTIADVLDSGYQLSRPVDEEKFELIIVATDSVLHKVYNDTPRYQFNDEVWHFFDNKYIKGVVHSLIPSYTTEPHKYNVLFENGGLHIVPQDLLAQFDENKLIDSTQTTINHINKVRENLASFAVQLIQRGEIHDNTKLFDPEKTLLDAMEYINVNEGNAPFGSPEYKRRTAILKPMLKHHYAAFPHHPEHFEAGVNGMSIVDVVEMLADWKAASERNGESEMSITQACARYKIDEQLKLIFINTAEMMGWKWK